MTINLIPAAPNAPLPATYEAAQRALAECSRIDECKDWADKAQALASYARQSKDHTMHSMALRIQQRAMRRAGELLKQIPSGSESNLVQHRQEGIHPSGTHSNPGSAPTQGPSTGHQGTAPAGPSAASMSSQSRQDGAVPSVTRTQVATDAGLSEHQRKTALRIASVPEPVFEAAVESATPPTVTQMAAMGTVQRPQPATAAPSPMPATIDQDARASAALNLLRDLTVFCATRDPVAIAQVVRDPDMARGLVESIDAWLDRFVTHLPAAADEMPHDRVG